MIAILRYKIKSNIVGVADYRVSHAKNAKTIY